MREIIKLSVTLAIVGILSALLLTGVYNVTDPIIRERQEEEYRQALEQYFPDFASFESEEIDGTYFDLIYDEGENLIGIMAIIEQQGYDGTITFNLAVGSEGEIVGLRVVSHTETPGIGDVITTDSFIEQFIGKDIEDEIAAGVDVDAISGATISTVAIINAVRREMAVIGESFMGVEVEEIDIQAVPDGTYEGSALGLNGPIVVEVVVEAGEIKDIAVQEHEETATYFIESYPLIPDLIIEKQHFDIDTKTGATISANAIVDAVKDALKSALDDEGGGE